MAQGRFDDAESALQEAIDKVSLEAFVYFELNQVNPNV